MSGAPVVLRIWLPHHEPSLACWCRPRSLDGGAVLHRRILGRPGSQERCMVRLIDGVPA